MGDIAGMVNREIPLADEMLLSPEDAADFEECGMLSREARELWRARRNKKKKGISYGRETKL